MSEWLEWAAWIWLMFVVPVIVGAACGYAAMTIVEAIALRWQQRRHERDQQ